MDEDNKNTATVAVSYGSSSKDSLAKPSEAELKKKEQEDEDKSYQAVPFRSMFRFATPGDVVLLSLGVLGGCANGVGMAAFSIILGQVFDALNGTDPNAAQRICLLFIYVGLALGAASILQFGCCTMASERMTVRLRRAYLESILRQEVGYFDENSNKLSSTVAEATIHFREALGEKFGSLFQFGGMFIAGLAVGFTYVWQLTLVILAITPLLGFSGYFMMTAMSKLVQGQVKAYAKAGGIAEESFSLIRTITGLNLQEKRISAFQDEVDQAAIKTANQGHVQGLGFGATMFFYFSSYGVAFWVGALLIQNARISSVDAFPLKNPPPYSFCAVNAAIPQNCTSQNVKGLVFQSLADVCNCPLCNCGCYPNGWTATPNCITGGDIVLTFFAVLIGSFGIGQAAPSITAMNKGRVAAAQVYSVIDRVPLIRNESTKRLSPLQGDISFSNIAFAYPSRRNATVFTNMSLNIKAGTRIGLCGQSGSGKSTIIQLLLRFYDPDAGEVKLDGVNIKSLDLDWYRSQIGLVSQEPVLFATTILENIRVGRLTATDEECMQAAREANAHNFIESFPDKYNTFVGTSGNQLSGGQKQRVAIARALLRNPKILLLDEATAALDNASEAIVNEAIQKLLLDEGSKRTSIVIAHRLSTIKQCDVIVVMERGVIVEQGSHDELKDRPDGMYASLLKISEGGNAKMEQSKSFVERSEKHEIKTIADMDQMTNASSTTLMTTATGAGKKDVQKAKPAKNVPLRRGYIFAKPDGLLFIPAMFAATINGVSFPIFALLLAEVMNVIFLPQISALMYQAMIWSVAFFIYAFILGLALYVMNVFFEKINGRMTARVRTALFKKLLSFEMGYYDMPENSVGAMTSKLASDAALVKAAITDRMSVAVQNIATVASGIIIAFIASWKLALVVFAIFPLLALAGMLQMMVMMGTSMDDQKDLSEASQTLTEAISGIRTVHAFAMQPKITEVYHHQLAGPMARGMKKGFTAGAGFGFSNAMMFFAYALCFWYGSKLIAEEGLSFKDMNQALFGVLMAAMALGQIAAMVPDLGKGQAAVNSVFGVLDRKSEIDPFSGEGSKPSVVKGEIELQGVSFFYPSRSELQVMDKLNLRIPRGKTVALVGQSGSGKSTVVQLVERFYDPNIEGEVLLDGVDIKTLELQWLRSQIGLISQEPALLDASIMDNIRSGRLDATDEECMQAAKDANAHDFIMKLPDKYNTMCGAKGGSLSGGQKQRVAIARGLVKNPTILLLDEATSALDENSQGQVQEALDRLLKAKERTTLIIAHRLSTVRNADIIFVLERGHVIEQGSYDELVAQDGAFSALLRAQERKD